MLKSTKSTIMKSSAATVVYPVSQLAPLSSSLEDNLSTETTGVGYVLDVLAQPSFQGGKWAFTAGYFNPSEGVKRGLIHGKATTGTVINASAEANGFFGSPNPSGYLPDAYMILARRFLEDVERSGMKNAIKMEEWRHLPRGSPLDGWTYHAKGIWITPPNSTQPILTLIGSSNFTRRSDRLDLESTCIVITKDPDLQASLSREIEHLREFTEETDPEKLNAILAEGGWRRAMAVRAWVAMVAGKL
jgi:CDP-diacylglycerol---glycerol-3-phosphate 3-phosphatidyltransferase